MAVSSSVIWSVPLLLAGLLVAAESAPADDWPMLGHNASRNAVSPERDAPAFWDMEDTDRNSGQPVRGGRNVKWVARLGSSCIAPPVVSQGFVWIGSNNDAPGVPRSESDKATLLCFREKDGQLVYRHVVPRHPGGHRVDYPRSPIGCSPLVERDRLWFFNTRGEIVCWDIGPLLEREETPVELWKLDLRNDLRVHVHAGIMFFERRCSIASYQDWIYVITNNGVDYNNARNIPSPDAPSLVCLDKHTGEVVWTDTSPGKNILRSQPASPLVVELNGQAQVIVPMGDGWVRSFAAAGNGQGDSLLLWEFDMNFKETTWTDFGDGRRNQILATPVLYKNRVYVASGQQPEHGEGPGRLVCLDPTRHGDISSELAVDAEGNRLPHRRLQAVNPDNGERAIPNPNSGLVWEFTTIGEDFEDTFHRSVSSVAIANDLVIACDLPGLVHCLDAATGQRYWAYDLLAYCKSSPLIVDGKVYVGDEDGGVAVFQLSKAVNGSNAPIAETNHDTSVNSSPIFANGVLYVPTRTHLFAIQNQSEESASQDGESQPEAFWPQWRGPHRDNLSTDTGLLKEWPVGGPPLLWRADGLGEGIASVSIADGRIFTLGYRDEQEYVTALSARMGRQLWMKAIGPAVAESRLMRWLGQRTPTIDEGRVYVVRSDGRLICLSVDDGRGLWRKSYTEDFGAKPHYWGICDYPLVDGDKLICCPGGSTASIVALSKKTGELVWKSEVGDDEPSSFVAPIVSEGGGIRQYITYFRKGLVSVAANDGRVLWRYDKLAAPFANSLTPIARGDLVLSYNGYGSGGALLRLLPNGGGVKIHEEYFESCRLDPFQDSTVWIGHYVHAFNRRGLLERYDGRTGELILRATNEMHKVPGKRSRGTSMTFADGHLIVRDAGGFVSLIEPTAEEYAVKSEFTIPDHQPALGATNPVVAGKRLWLRDDNRLFCYALWPDPLKHANPPPYITLRPGLSARHPDRPPRSVYVPTPHDVVTKMLTLANVKQEDVVYDLGSGDGRIVIAAAKHFGCHAIGYEIDSELVQLSRKQVADAGVEDRVRIQQRNIATVNLSGADVVTLYLVPRQLEALVPQLQKLKPGSRVVSHQFKIPGIEPDQAFKIESREDGQSHKIYLWRAPLPGHD